MPSMHQGTIAEPKSNVTCPSYFLMKNRWEGAVVNLEPRMEMEMLRDGYL